jgi:hypothetical protein
MVPKIEERGSPGRNFAGAWTARRMLMGELAADG